jgi:hypothetical protein
MFDTLWRGRSARKIIHERKHVPKWRLVSKANHGIKLPCKHRWCYHDRLHIKHLEWRVPKSRGETHLRVSQSQVAESWDLEPHSRLPTLERGRGSNLTPGPSFAHNLGCICPNGQCEVVFDIYASRTFQWHQEHLNARCFGPICRTLNIRESRRTLNPQLWKCWASPPHLAKMRLRHRSELIFLLPCFRVKFFVRMDSFRAQLMWDKLAYRATYRDNIYFWRYKTQPSWHLSSQMGMVQCCKQADWNNMTVPCWVNKIFRA